MKSAYAFLDNANVYDKDGIGASDKLEATLSWLGLVAGGVAWVMPLLAFFNYPEGVVTEPMIAIERFYIFCGGLTIFFLEVGDVGSQSMIEFEHMLMRQVRLLERVTGRGIFMVFLGCNIWNIINPVTQGVGLELLIFLSGIYTIAVGVIHIIVGLKQTILLDRVRQKLQNWRFEGKPVMPNTTNINPGETFLLERLNHRENLDRFLLTFAVNAGKYGGGGSEGNSETSEIMLDSEFNTMCQVALQNPNFYFSKWEMKNVVRAISAGGEGGGLLADVTQELGLPTTPLLFFSAIYEWLSPGCAVML